jgi:hypothetical protein
MFRPHFAVIFKAVSSGVISLPSLCAIMAGYRVNSILYSTLNSRLRVTSVPTNQSRQGLLVPVCVNLQKTHH